MKYIHIHCRPSRDTVQGLFFFSNNCSVVLFGVDLMEKKGKPRPMGKMGRVSWFFFFFFFINGDIFLLNTFREQPQVHLPQAYNKTVDVK